MKTDPETTPNYTNNIKCFFTFQTSDLLDLKSRQSVVIPNAFPWLAIFPVPFECEVPGEAHQISPVAFGRKDATAERPLLQCSGEATQPTRHQILHGSGFGGRAGRPIEASEPKGMAGPSAPSSKIASMGMKSLNFKSIMDLNGFNKKKKKSMTIRLLEVDPQEISI